MAVVYHTRFFAAFSGLEELQPVSGHSGASTFFAAAIALIMCVTAMPLFTLPGQRSWRWSTGLHMPTVSCLYPIQPLPFPSQVWRGSCGNYFSSITETTVVFTH